MVSHIINAKNILVLISENEDISNKIYQFIENNKINSLPDISLILNYVNGTYKERIIQMLNLVDYNNIKILNVIMRALLKHNNNLNSILSLFI